MREDISGRVYENFGEMPPHMKRLHRMQMRAVKAERGEKPRAKRIVKALAESPLGDVFKR